MIQQVNTAKAALLAGALSAFVAILYSCLLVATHPPAEQFITLTCTGSNPYFFYYFDDFLEEHTGHFSIDTATQTCRTIQLKTAGKVFLRFSGNDDQLLVLANPGDTIVVDPARNEIRGNRAAEHAFYSLLDKKKISMATPDFWNLNWTSTMNFRAVTDEFERLRRSRMNVLDSLRRKSLVSAAFYAQTGREINSAWLSAWLIPFIKEHGTTLACSDLPSWYTDTLTAQKAFFADDSLLGQSSLYYRYCLNSYVSFLTYQDKQRNPSTTPYQTALAHLTGKHRDAALFYAYKVQLEENNPAFSKNPVTVDKDIQDKRYVTYLRRFANDIRARNTRLTTGQFDDRPLEALTGATVRWRDVLTRNKNTVVYLDLWASWCGPCRREMPASIALSTTLKDKPIKFIYISIDSDRAKWLSAVKKLAINQGKAQHYRLNPNDSLAHYLTNNTVPSYVIIDKAGIVKTLDGSRPGDAQTKHLLRSLADE